MAVAGLRTRYRRVMTASAPTTPRTGAGAEDRTRERAAAINQLLMSLVVLIATVIMVLSNVVRSPDLLVVGVVGVFAMTGVAVAVPWNRLPPLSIIVLPLIDIIAVAILEFSTPGAGFSLLWVFPALWLAFSFGWGGALTGSVAVSVVFWLTVFALPNPQFRPTMVLLPFTVGALSLAAYLASRRSTAQRALLSKQGASLKRTLDRVQRQEELVSEVLDAVDFGVVRIDAEGATAVANDAHARLQAVAETDDPEARAIFMADGLTPLDPESEPIARARRGEAFESELVWYGPPGRRRRALRVTARELPGSDGESAGRLVVSQDVTAEMTALRAREDLVSSVSHELRTPLTSILGYLDLALDADGLPAAARSNLEVVERNATRLLTIVADILARSADARGGISLTFQPEQTDLSALVRAAVEGIGTQAQKRAITLDEAGIEPVSAWVDPLRMRQVVDNLLSNAVKYHHDGGLIEIGVTSDGDHAWVVVRDDGPGIPADEVPRLFDRFYRADAVRHTSTHGSGLGLAISQDIMRRQGGDITVRSVEGEGSTFIARIPVRQQMRST